MADGETLHLVNVEDIRVSADTTFGQTIQQLDRAGVGIVLIMDDQDHLVGTVTDGDVRRGIVEGKPLTDRIATMDRPAGYKEATAIGVASTREERLQLMRARGLRHLPLLDLQGRVVDVALRTDYVEPQPDLTAIIFAGGYGTRLQPLTADTPKPMLEIGGRPLLEHIVEQLRTASISDILISTHFRPERIAEHFGDGDRFGVNIKYVQEETPLGTAGALGLIPKPASAALIVNGDILTDLDFRTVVDFHHDHNAMMTVAVRRYDLQVPYGVIESKGIEVSGLTEKPLLEFFINAGIYVVEPAVFARIPKGRRFDMTELVTLLLEKKERVISFPIREYWLDIGQHSDYEKAVRDISEGRVRVEAER